jgi:hypothetical protein
LAGARGGEDLERTKRADRDLAELRDAEAAPVFLVPEVLLQLVVEADGFPHRLEERGRVGKRPFGPRLFGRWPGRREKDDEDSEDTRRTV